MFGLAEIELEYRRERQADGIRVAKSNGVDTGRKKGTTKGKPRLQVVWRKVELGIFTEDFHNFVTINADRLTNGSHLIAENDLEGMPSVIDIFHHLRQFDGGAEQRCIEFIVQAGQPITA